MIIGIAGLGLIGASAAKRAAKCGHEVLGYDLPEVLSHCIEKGIVSGELEGNFSGCDIIISALYPHLTVEFANRFASEFGKNTIFTDFGGTKRMVCEACSALAEKFGFTFIGAHPMAGKECWGEEYSTDSLFEGASLIVMGSSLPEKYLGFMKELGFSHFQFSNPEEHDKMIAYTSQLAHIASGAFVKSPSAKCHFGFSAGSFKDLTRVAKLNENMWADLFLQNADNLTYEIDLLISHLKEYSDAIRTENREELKRLLAEGRIIKEEISEGEKNYAKGQS